MVFAFPFKTHNKHEIGGICVIAGTTLEIIFPTHHFSVFFHLISSIITQHGRLRTVVTLSINIQFPFWLQIWSLHSILYIFAPPSVNFEQLAVIFKKIANTHWPNFLPISCLWVLKILHVILSGFPPNILKGCPFSILLQSMKEQQHRFEDRQWTSTWNCIQKLVEKEGKGKGGNNKLIYTYFSTKYN